MGHLVSNAILAQLTERYKLMERLRTDPNTAMSIKASEKNRGNLFEAHLCGVYDSHLSTNSGTPKTDGEALDDLSRWLAHSGL
jgi:dsRNA-specific ribonuclease